MEGQIKIDEALYDACVKGDLNEVKVLLLCGGNPCHVFNGNDWTAIHVAVNNSDDGADILDLIISSGHVKNINIGRISDSLTPLHIACLNGNVKCAKMLVENGADVTLKNKLGDGIIHYAMFSRNVSMVEEYLKWNGVNVNQRGMSNRTALIWACMADEVDLVRVLLSAGADVNLKDDDGYPALWYGKNNMKIKELFLSHLSKPQEKKASSVPTTAIALPTALGEMFISSRNNSKDLAKGIIEKVFPKFDDSKMKAIFATIEHVGVDFEDYQPEDLLLLKENDFPHDVLKPLEARKLLNAFHEEYGKNAVVSF